MDIQFKGEDEGPYEVENEYHLEVKIETVTVSQHEHSQLQLIFVFGDLLSKLSTDDGSFNGKQQRYILHSVPGRLSEMLHELSIMLCVISLADQKPLGEFSPHETCLLIKNFTIPRLLLR